MSLTKATYSMIEGAVINVLDYDASTQRWRIMSYT
jgi:hypothetical protein